MVALAPMRAGRCSDAAYLTLGCAGDSMADMEFAHTHSQRIEIRDRERSGFQYLCYYCIDISCFVKSQRQNAYVTIVFGDGKYWVKQVIELAETERRQPRLLAWDVVPGDVERRLVKRVQKLGLTRRMKRCIIYFVSKVKFLSRLL